MYVRRRLRRIGRATHTKMISNRVRLAWTAFANCALFGHQPLAHQLFDTFRIPKLNARTVLTQFGLQYLVVVALQPAHVSSSTLQRPPPTASMPGRAETWFLWVSGGYRESIDFHGLSRFSECWFDRLAERCPMICGPCARHLLGAVVFRHSRVGAQNMGTYAAVLCFVSS